MVSLILVKDAFLNSLDFRLNIAELPCVKSGVLSLLGPLHLALLVAERFPLVLEPGLGFSGCLQFGQQLPLLALLLSHVACAQEQPRAVELLLFYSVVVLELPFGQAEQLFVILLHNIVDFLFELSQLSLQLFYDSLLFFFSLLLFLLILLHLAFLLLAHLLQRLLHPLLALHRDLQS